MATLVTSYQVSDNTQAATALVTTPSFTPSPGEIIVVKALTNNPVAPATPTGGGLTYTVRASSNVASNVSVAIYTAVVGASPTSMAVSVGWSGSERRSIVVERWSSAALAATPATNTTKTGADTAPSATVTTTAANSVVTWVDGDWNESTGTVTYRSGAVQELQHLAAGSFSGWFAYQTAAAAGAQTIGMTAPPSQKWSMVGIEILDASVTTSTITTSDAVSVADSAYTIQPASASDSVSVTDVGVAGQITATSDSVGVGESTSTKANLTASQPVGVSESVSSRSNLNVGTDPVSVTDTQKIIIPRSDSAAVSETTSTKANLTASQPVSVAEGVTIETLYGDLVISLYAIHPTTGALVPLPDFTKLTLSPQRNSAGSISLEYPSSGLNFDLLRSTITGDRDLEIEVWNLGSPTGALRGYLQEAAGDDVSEDGLWQFAGGFLELRMSEAVVFPQPVVGVPSLGPEVTVVHGTISQAKWDQLLALGYTGRAGDEQEALYVPQLVLDAVNNGTTVPVLADPKRELKFSAVTPGELVGFIMAQARARGTFTDIEWDFTAAKDSGGTAWPNVLSTKFSPGAGYDQILNKLVDLGLAEWSVEWSGTKRVLRLWVPQGRGVDRTVGNRPVVLRKGRNLLEAPRKWSVRESGTAILAAGSEGIYETAADASAVARRGRRIEVSASANNVSDSAAVQAYAQAQLAVTTPGLLEVTHGIGFLPGEPRPIIAFGVGDWVYSQTSTSMDRLRVVQWTLTVDAKQNPSGTVTLNDTVQDALVRLQRRLNALTAGETVVGTSEASNAGEDTIPPAAPTGLVADSIAYQDSAAAETYASVTVGWTPPDTNVDGTAVTDLSGYRVRYAYRLLGQVGGIPSSDPFPESDMFWYDPTPYDGITGTSYTFGGVGAGTDIRIQVRAFDRDNNMGPWSDYIEITTEADNTPPPVASAPSVAAWFATMDVRWDGLDVNGAVMPLDFDHVEVHISQANNFTPDATTYKADLFAAGTWNQPDLPYGIGHYARLVAVDRAGNKSEPSATSSVVTAEKLVSDDLIDSIITAPKIADFAVGSAKIVDAAIVTAKIASLAVNDAKIADLSVGKLVAGTLQATVVLGGIIQTNATGVGQRMRIDSSGFQGYNSAGTLFAQLNITAGTFLMTGTYQSALTGERINILPDGTLRFYPSAGANYSQMSNFGSDVVWRGPLDANGRSGRVNVNQLGVGLNFSAESEIPSNLRGEIAVFNNYAKMTSPRIDLILNGKQSNGSIRSVAFYETDGSGNSIGSTRIEYKNSAGVPGFVGIGHNAGWKAEDGFFLAVNAAMNSLVVIKAADFIVPSSKKVKDEIGDVRTLLDPIQTIRGARAKRFIYTADRWRTPPPTEEDPNPAPVEVTDPPVRIGPMAEDLPAALVQEAPSAGGSAPVLSLSLVKQLGVLWAWANLKEDQRLLGISAAVKPPALTVPNTDVDVTAPWDEGTAQTLPAVVSVVPVGPGPLQQRAIAARVVNVTTAGVTVRFRAKRALTGVAALDPDDRYIVNALYLHTPPFEETP